MISAIDTTNVKYICGECDTEDTIAITSLEAGTRVEPDGVRLPACTSCSTERGLVRSWLNSKEAAGAINGLHRWLVDNDYINSNWITYLKNETEGQKPQFYYTVTATTRAIKHGTGGVLGYDTEATLLLFSVADCRRLVDQFRFITAEGDAAIATFVGALYGGEESSEKYAQIVAARTLLFP